MKFLSTVKHFRENKLRPHVYCNQEFNSIPRSNSGSFGRAMRFEDGKVTEFKNTLRKFKRSEVNPAVLRARNFIRSPVPMTEVQRLTPSVSNNLGKSPSFKSSRPPT